MQRIISKLVIPDEETGAGFYFWAFYLFWLLLVVSPLKIGIYFRFWAMAFRYKAYYPILRTTRGICFVSLVQCLAVLCAIY